MINGINFRSIFFKKGMYYKRVIKAGKTVEIYKSYTKNISPRRTGAGNIPKEETDKINRANAITKLTRKLNANFCENDYHIILTYRPEDRPDEAGAKRILKKFLRKLREIYKKAGRELKYIHVTEYKRKNIHHHVVISGIDETVREATRLWRDYGRVRFIPLEDNGQYRKLAEYLIKETDKTFREKNGGQMQRYTPSRNIVTPEAKVTKIHAKSWNLWPKPVKGYYLDEESLYNGFNPFTGGQMQKYTLIEIKKKKVQRE